MTKRSHMARRDFIKLGFGLAPAIGIAGMLTEGAWATSAKSDISSAMPMAGHLSEIEAFNYVIGTQTIGATYQFTQDSVLIETAKATIDLGSNTLKFTMGRGYQRMMLKASKAAYPETMQYLLNQGIDARDKPRLVYPGASEKEPGGNAGIRTLTDLARIEPSYRQALGMPFAYYLIWTYAFTPRWWHEGFPVEEQKKEYREIYDFATYLLKTFNGTGKTFFIGHWEGDWHLRPDLQYQTDRNITPEAIQGMIDWLNARQKAVDDAKRDTPHAGVQVFHYSEVNHVTAVSMQGRPSATNSVLPKTNVDYASYSTYDSLGDINHSLPKALSYIESKLQPKPGIKGKRVFIGEYGFAARQVPEAERDRRSRAVMRVGLEWGCPFILCWQMYNNEFKDGKENGYWLIDDQGVKQPLWHTHHRFYGEARRYVADFKQKAGRMPNSEEYRHFAVALLDRFENESH